MVCTTMIFLGGKLSLQLGAGKDLVGWHGLRSRYNFFTHTCHDRASLCPPDPVP